MHLVKDTVPRVPAPKKPDERQFKVGDHVTVSLSAGRVVDGVVKAVINRVDGRPVASGLRRRRDRASVSVAGLGAEDLSTK